MKLRPPAIVAGILVLCLAVTVGSADPPAQDQAGKTAAAQTLCPVCRRPVQPDWQFCPYDGSPLERPDSDIIAGESPKGVVFRFYQAYPDRNRDGLAACLDLEGILTDLLNRGLDQLEELTPEIRQILKEKLTPTMSRAMMGSLLDVLVSDQMQKEFPPPADVSRNSVDLYYHEEIVGDTATLRPTRAAELGGRSEGSFVLVRKEKRWVITKLPGMTVR